VLTIKSTVFSVINHVHRRKTDDLEKHLTLSELLDIINHSYIEDTTEFA
jgi:hypothetical protein